MKYDTPEYVELIEVLRQDLEPGISELATESRASFFLAANGMTREGLAQDPRVLTDSLGYIGAIAYVTALTPNCVVDRDTKLEILSESVAHLDKIAGRRGRVAVLGILRGTEQGLFRANVRGTGNEALRGEVFDLYMTARSQLKGKSRRQAVAERLSRVSTNLYAETNEDVLVLLAMTRDYVTDAR